METNTLPSYNDTIEALDSFHNLERSGMQANSFSGGVERMLRLVRRLGSPHAAIPAVHVAGTKGKGSVAHLAAAALSAAGLKTGLYTSPHVDTLRERIQIQGRPATEERFAEAARSVLSEAAAMRADGDAPSWFEVLTAIAFVVFKNARVEAMVLETGLGGRLDATNLPDLRLAAVGITPISRDHEDILGSGLASIAAEKAAIIRENVPVVAAGQESGVMRLIEERARARHAPLFRVGSDIHSETRKTSAPDKPFFGQRLDMETWRNVYPDIPLAMLGSHQAENAGLALGLVELFLEYMDRESLDCMVLKRAWRGMALPARMEVVASRPWRIVDGGHNPASAWAACETLLESFSTPPASRTLIFGVAQDKDYVAMLRILTPLFGSVVLTPFASPRAASPEELNRVIRKEFPGVSTTIAVDPAHAIDLAERITPEDGLMLATGSLWLAGEIRALSHREKAANPSGAR